MSKIFERIIFRQISNHMESFLLKYQCGFRKGYSTQHCLLFMLEKWKRAVDNGKVFGILLTDLFKAFDCLSHELLLAKLHAYGFSISALRLIYSYLAKRKQITKINSSYNSREEILFRVPQGSILGPLLFLCDMFFELSQILRVMLMTIHHTWKLIMLMKLLQYYKIIQFSYLNGSLTTR